MEATLEQVEKMSGPCSATSFPRSKALGFFLTFAHTLAFEENGWGSQKGQRRPGRTDASFNLFCLIGCFLEGTSSDSTPVMASSSSLFNSSLPGNMHPLYTSPPIQAASCPHSFSLLTLFYTYTFQVTQSNSCPFDPIDRVAINSPRRHLTTGYT